jgi:hypothetical protein
MIVGLFRACLTVYSVGEGDGQSKDSDAKKGSKQRKASAKVERKSAAKRTAAKKVKLKVRRASGVVADP